MIVGIAKALQRATSRLPEDGPHLQALRNRLLDGLRRHVPDLRLNGHPTERLPGNLSVSFPGVKAADLMGLLPQYAVSAGSACASGKPKPSHVLEAIGLPADLLACTIRFSPCAETPERVIDEAANAFGEGARTLLQRIPS
jgi:cysteine desulfurase